MVENYSIIPEKKKKKTSVMCFYCLLALMLIIFSVHFYQGYRELQLKQSKLAEIYKQVEVLEAEYQKLLSQSENLDSQKYIERIAREELGLIRKGEILIIPIE